MTNTGIQFFSYLLTYIYSLPSRYPVLCLLLPSDMYSLYLLVGLNGDRFYPQPKKGAESVEGRVAFYVGRVPGLRVGVPPVA